MEKFPKFEQPSEEISKPEQPGVEQGVKKPESVKEQLENFYGKPLAEIYHEDVAEGLRQQQEQLRILDRDIEVAHKIKEYLERSAGGEKLPEEQQKIVEFFREQGIDEKSLEQKAKEIGFDKWSLEQGIAEYKNLYNKELTEKSFLTSKFGAFEEFLSEEEKQKEEEPFAVKPPEIKIERSWTPEKEAQYEEYLKGNYEEVTEKAAKLEAREKELQEKIDSLWPTQFYKRNLLRYELADVRGLKEQWFGWAKGWKEKIDELGKEREQKQPAKGERQEKVSKRKEGAERQVEELTEKVASYNTAIGEITEALERLWPWQINQRYKLLAKLDRAQRTVSAYLKAIDGLKRGKILFHYDFRKSVAEELG